MSNPLNLIMLSHSRSTKFRTQLAAHIALLDDAYENFNASSASLASFRNRLTALDRLVQQNILRIPIEERQHVFAIIHLWSGHFSRAEALFLETRELARRAAAKSAALEQLRQQYGQWNGSLFNANNGLAIWTQFVEVYCDPCMPEQIKFEQFAQALSSDEFGRILLLGYEPHQFEECVEHFWNSFVAPDIRRAVMDRSSQLKDKLDDITLPGSVENDVNQIRRLLALAISMDAPLHQQLVDELRRQMPFSTVRALIQQNPYYG